VNQNRVYRLYREDGLSLRLKKPRRNVSAANRERQPAALAANEMWSMDFVSDALFDGRRLRALTVVDAFTREALAIDVDQGIKGEQVVEVMTRISSIRGAPKTIRVDNGPEFISKVLDRWAEQPKVSATRSVVGMARGGIRERRHAGLQQAGQAYGQRLCRELQRSPTRRVPERPLVPVAGGRPDQDRGLATRLQREPSSHIARAGLTPVEYAAVAAAQAAERTPDAHPQGG